MTASVARTNPELRPVLEPLLIGYVAFALTTWTAVPLSNLFLRLNRFGRYALSAVQRRASHWVGAFTAAALAGVGWGLLAHRDYAWLGWPAALGFAILLVPVSGTFACQRGWPRLVMGLVTAVMTVLVVSAVVLFGVGVSLDGRDNAAVVAAVRRGLDLIQANTWAGLASAFLANYLANVRPRR